MFLTAFYGLGVTYDKTVTRPNVTGFNRFWSVAVRLWVYYHIRQPVAVPVTQNWAEKPDLTGLLNTSQATTPSSESTVGKCMWPVVSVKLWPPLNELQHLSTPFPNGVLNAGRQCGQEIARGRTCSQRNDSICSKPLISTGTFYQWEGSLCYFQRYREQWSIP